MRQESQKETNRLFNVDAEIVKCRKSSLHHFANGYAHQVCMLCPGLRIDVAFWRSVSGGAGKPSGVTWRLQGRPPRPPVGPDAIMRRFTLGNLVLRKGQIVRSAEHRPRDKSRGSHACLVITLSLPGPLLWGRRGPRAGSSIRDRDRVAGRTAS